MAADEWTFRAGLVAGDASLKGYEVDGDAGRVSWCDYARGESPSQESVREYLDSFERGPSAGTGT